MSNKIAYELLAPQAHKILTKLLATTDYADMIKIYQEYMDLLNASGWTDDEFDSKTLEMVNKNWTPKELLPN